MVAVSSNAKHTTATGTMTNDARSPYDAPNTPVVDGRIMPPVTAITITTLIAVPDSCAYRSPTNPSTTGNDGANPQPRRNTPNAASDALRARISSRAPVNAIERPPNNARGGAMRRTAELT